MTDVPTVRIKRPPASPHPWIWNSKLLRERGRGPAPGVVRVEDRDGGFVGWGLYHPKVTIALRILSRDPDQPIDEGFFVTRLERALELRRALGFGEGEHDAFRWVHAEADGLSGLMVDVFGPVIRAEVFCRGIAQLRPQIEAALKRVLPERAVSFRADARTGKIEGFSIKPGRDEPREVEVREQGVRFKVDLREGHKTGFFLDQRENRGLVAELSKGREVLDCHTYSGGFALRAAHAGAQKVTAVDLDEKALEVAKRNAKLNQLQNTCRFVHADAFAYLRQRIENRQRADVVVLDPPKLARDRSEKGQALRAYTDLNRLGLEATRDDGFLVTNSCTGVAPASCR